MLQDFMWTTFEKTGNIDAYLSYKEFEKFVVKDEKVDESDTLSS